MENNTTKQNNTAFSVLEKIERGEVTAHSKNYFRLKVLALVFTISSTFIVSILLCSFILFNLRASGQASLIGFGSHGTLLFFLLFPWKFFLVNIILIILSGLLIRSFRFGYKIPVLYLGGAFIIVMTLIGITLDQLTNLPPSILKNANTHSVPIFGNLYQNAIRPPFYLEGIYRGVVISVGTNSFQIRVAACCTIPTLYTVTPPATFLIDKIKTGTYVLVEGKANTNTISATEIETISAPPSFEE